MKKVFLFGIGDQSRLMPIIEKLNEQNIDYEVGPSIADDIYLCKEYRYYRESKELKIYSFMSDVGRAYKMSNNSGIYIDVSVELGDKFFTLFENIEKCDAGFPRCRGNEIAGNIMGSNGKSTFFSEVLENFKMYDGPHPQTFFIGPHIADFVAQKRKYFSRRNDKKFTVENILFDTAEPTFSESLVKKFGDESGKIGDEKSKTKTAKSYAEFCNENGGNLPSGRIYNTKKSLPRGDLARVNLCTMSKNKEQNLFAKIAQKKYLKKYKFIPIKNGKIGFVFKRFFNYENCSNNT